jgi:hypothetical protein
MSLFHLIHKNVIIKFTDSAGSQFNPEASYGFRLTGVDGMGFLQLQELKASSPGEPETASEAYWINKDLVREIHEFSPTKTKGVIFTATPLKPVKAKSAAKAKST